MSLSKVSHFSSIGTLLRYISAENNCGHYVLYAEDHRSLQRLHKPLANSKKDEDNTVVRQK